MTEVLKNTIIGILLFSAVVTTFFLFASDITTHYNVNISDEYVSAYDDIRGNINDSYGITKQMQEKVESGEGITLGETATAIGGASLTALTLPFEGLKNIITTIGITGEKLGMPTYWQKVILSIIILTVIIAFLSWVFRRNG